MNVLCFGAGAIGTYIGGSLALKGHHVTFLEKPEFITPLLENGLRMTLSGSLYHIPAPQLLSELHLLPELEPFDIAVFALKSYDTSSAIQQLLPVRQFLPPILCLQNGVENETHLREALGEDNVIAGTVTSAVARLGVGEIKLEKLRGMGIAKGHAMSRSLVNAMNDAGLQAQFFNNADGMKWSKMLTNLLTNASSAILGFTPAQIFENPQLYKLEILQLRETLKVIKALNLKVENLPGTPVKALSFAAQFLPLPLSRLFLQRAVAEGRGGKMPSFYIDLQSGRGVNEVSYLNGAVVRFGEKMRIPTPVNYMYTTILEGLTKGTIPLSSYLRQPDKLISSLGKITQSRSITP